MNMPEGISVFNHSAVALWEVSRDTYRQRLVSWAELERRVCPAGLLGAHLI
ncbi:hypothetical protein KIH74_15175 [Kineosporia sp. J2-2]|uniref:Uncharacterized protein n=1 Tax=Kineosporia corallincola TaxID=2835133 RepID=A0ABS5TGU4_9ACTN|nr:hypothetical protein [Kineosporia corallincola]MBT0770282.1 hypothetical protein [Kineosporia corallincola]